mgnify:FL=1
MARVLVVDDEKLIVKGIRFSLEQDGYEVDCAYDGEEAIEMELRRMREELLEQRELDKVINRFESNDLFSNLHYLNKATNLAYYELLGGAESIDTEVEKYKKLTPFDLRRIAEKLFVPENSSTLWYKSVHAKREIITDISD